MNDFELCQEPASSPPPEKREDNLKLEPKMTKNPNPYYTGVQRPELTSILGLLCCSIFDHIFFAGFIAKGPVFG